MTSERLSRPDIDSLRAYQCGHVCLTHFVQTNTVDTCTFSNTLQPAEQVTVWSLVSLADTKDEISAFSSYAATPLTA